MSIIRNVVLMLLAAPVAGAALADSVTYWEEAPVVKSVPVYDEIERRVPVEHCTKVAVAPSEQGESAVPVVVGGIIGGVLGNQVGDGKGKKVATAAGVLLGSAVGADAAKRAEQNAPKWRRECEVRHEVHRERHLSGYRVTYRYRDEEHETFTETPPGDTLRLAVRVSPAE